MAGAAAGAGFFTKAAVGFLVVDDAFATGLAADFFTSFAEVFWTAAGFLAVGFGADLAGFFADALAIIQVLSQVKLEVRIWLKGASCKPNGGAIHRVGGSSG